MWRLLWNKMETSSVVVDNRLEGSAWESRLNGKSGYCHSCTEYLLMFNIPLLCSKVCPTQMTSLPCDNLLLASGKVSVSVPCRDMARMRAMLQGEVVQGSGVNPTELMIVITVA